MRKGLAALMVGWAILTPAAGRGQAAWFPGVGELEPFRLTGDVAPYTPENLWERIDGEAELYRRFGLRTAAVGLFEVSGEPDRSLEVSVFQVETALEAFGLFASFRDPARAEEALGNGGQVGDAVAYFWHGSTFVHLYASGPDASRRTDLRRAAEALTRQLGPAPERPVELARFEAVAERATVRYQPDHLLGREALPPGLEGVASGGLRVAVADAAGAPAAFVAYGAVLTDLGRASDGVVDATSGTDPAHGPVTVAVRGTRLAAVLAPVAAARTLPLLRALLNPPGPTTLPRPGPP